MSLSWFNRQGRGQKARRSPQSKPTRKPKIQFQDLEDRTVPATGTLQFEQVQVSSAAEGGVAEIKVTLVTSPLTPINGVVTAVIADINNGVAGEATHGSDYTFGYAAAATPQVPYAHREAIVKFSSADIPVANGVGDLVYTKVIRVDPDDENSASYLTLLDDSVVEGTEIINLKVVDFSLTDTNGISIGFPAMMPFNVTDTDAAVISITSPAAVSESATSITFQVSTNTQIDIPVAVDVTYSGGNAIGGTDYNNAAGLANIPALSTAAVPVTVPIINDSILETTETFLANLSTNTALGTRQVTFSGPGTGTINDNETATVAISPATTTVTEAAGAGNTANVVATLTINPEGLAGPGGTLGVDLVASLNDTTVVPGIGVDYTAPAVTFVAGVDANAATKNIVVTGINDNVVELTTESFTTTLALNANGTAATPTGTQQIDVVSDDTATFTIDDVTVNEAAGTMTFTVATTNPLDTNATITVSYTDVSATGGTMPFAAATDYHDVDDVITFTPGQTSKTVTVNINDDNIVDGDETFTADIDLTPTLPGYLTSDTDSGTGTILDNDVATFNVANVSQTEATSPMTFTISLSNPIDIATTVNVTFPIPGSTATGGGTLVYPDDFVNTMIPVTFAAGDTVKTFDVTINNDNVVELNETFNVSMALAAALPATYQSNTADTATGTIVNDDTATFTIDDASTAEGGSAGFVIHLSNPIDIGATINVQTTSGTATGGADYANSVVAVAFGANDNVDKTANVVTVNDIIAENTENFSAAMTLGAIPSLAAYGSSIVFADTATGTITDNDTATLTFNDPVVDEAAGTMTFTITSSNPIDKDVVLNVAYANGTATGGDPVPTFVYPEDFDNTTDNVTLTAGTTTISTTVLINNDNVVEGNETLTASMTTPTNLTGYSVVTSDTGTGTITNDDTATFTVENVSQSEGTSPMVFTITSSNPIDIATTVNVTFPIPGSTATGGGALTYPTDYNNTMVPVAFGALATSVPFNVGITDDNYVELDETFNVSMALAAALPTGYLSNTSDTATGTIQNDDTATFEIDNVQRDENQGTMTFTVTTTNPIDSNATINVSYGSGTATGGGVDYDSATDQVTFTPGQTMHTVTVALINDRLVEADETFTASLGLDGSTPLTGYSIVTSDTGTGTITSTDDTATIALASTTSAATEGGTNATVGATLAINATGIGTIALGNQVTVHLAVDPLGAADVTLPTAPAYTFLAGAIPSTVNATVVATNDTIVEPTEAYGLTLTGLNDPTGDVTLVAGTNTVTITDNDYARLSIQNGRTSATEGGATGLVDVTLTVYGNGTPGVGSLGTNVTVALSPGDDDFTSSSVLFSSNDTSGVKQLVVTAVDDHRIEATPEEDVGGGQVLVITNLNPAGADVAVDPSSGTRNIDITDNDSVRLIYSHTGTNISVTEGSGTTAIVKAELIFVTSGDNFLTPPSLSVPGLDVSVKAAVTSSPTDFTSTTVEWLPGDPESIKDIEVTAFDDRLVEATTETLTADLFPTSFASVNPEGNVTVVVTENDSATVVLDPLTGTVTATEGGAAQPVTARITLNTTGTTGIPALDTPISVNFAGNSQYTSAAGVFAVGALDNSTATINVSAINDNIVEASPVTFSAQTTTATTLATLTPASVAGSRDITIVDDDVANFTINNVSVAEGGTMTFTVSLNKAFDVPVTVQIGFSDGGAGQTNGSDFDHTPVSVTFAAGQTVSTPVSVSIAATDDSLVEATETFATTLTVLTSLPNHSVTTTGGTGTITDNDTATFTVQNASVNESAGTVTLNIATGVNVLDIPVAITVTYADQTALGFNVDYNSTAGTANFLAGSTTPTTAVTVPIINDNIAETVETFLASLSTSTPLGGRSVAFSAPATISINDNDTVNFSINSVTVNESAGTMSFLVSIDKEISTAATVNVNFADVTTTGPDFNHTPVQVAFAANSTTPQMVTVSINDENLVEATETFTAAIALDGTTPLTGYSFTIGAAGTGTIQDNDAAVFSILPVTVNEGAGTMSFVVSLNNPIDIDFDVNVGYTPGTAQGSNIDFDSATDLASFPTGSIISQTVTVAVNNENLVELTESFAVALAAATGLGGRNITANAMTTGTITDNDAAVITIGDVTVNEAAGTATFQIISSNPIDTLVALSVNYGGGTAQGGLDYDSGADSTNLPAFSTGPVTVDVNIFNDSLAEANETFIATLTSSTIFGTRNVTVNDQGTGTIIDNDGAIFTVEDVTVNEGAGTATFTIAVQNPLDIDVVVEVGYAGVSATGGTVDFDSATDSVTFSANSTATRTVIVNINDDSIIEAAETFNVILSSPTNLGGRSANFNDGAVGTITDNDTAKFTISDVTVNEGDTATFTISLDKPIDTDVTLNVNYTDGTATGGGVDYDSASDQVIFLANTTAAQTVTVATTAESINETIENFTAGLTLASSVGTRVLDLTDMATGSIVDHNEAPTVTVPGSQNFLANLPLTILGISTNDIEVSLLDANIQVTLSVTNGGITLGTLGGLTFSAGDGTNDATMTFQGKLASVNAALASITYNPTQDTLENDVLTVSANDLGSLGAGGPMTTTQTIALNAPSNLAQNQKSPVIANANDLVVYGTSGDDTILVKAASGGYRVILNNVDLGRILGTRGRIVVFGGDGNDTITISSAIGRGAYLVGGDGNDILNGGKGKDTLSGGEGSDTFKGGAGSDLLYEKADTNITLVSGTSATDGSLTTAGLGNDVIVRKGVERAHLVGGASNNIIDTTNFIGRVTLMGGAGDDQLSSGKLQDVLVGGDGNDTLNGNDGRDLLIGGAGIDVLNGGAHDDILVGSSTAHDDNATSLNLIMAEWTLTTRSLLARINRVSGITTRAAKNKGIVLRSTTVFNDFTNDTFTGGLQNDYFVNFLGETLGDFGTGVDYQANLITT